MTEALNRHLPERPRLRVPLRPRPAAVRPRCRASLAATLKPSTLPFEALKAMSENPALFRRFWFLLPLVILALTFSPVRAAETNAPAPATPAVAAATAAETKPVAIAATTSTTAVTAPASTNVTAVAAPSPASSSSTPDSGRSERSPQRDGSSPRSDAAPATNAPPGSFESFRLIAERNIFDPNRSPRAPRSSGTTEEPKRVPKIEAFALAGTMSFSNRPVAFFTSPSSQYQKALKPGDVIAGYQIAAVSADHVKLEREGAALELKVNQQMRREDEGPWQVSARSEVVASSPSAAAASSGAPTGAGTGTTAAPAGSASDALRKLMEQRAKEQ